MRRMSVNSTYILSKTADTIYIEDSLNANTSVTHLNTVHKKYHMHLKHNVLIVNKENRTHKSLLIKPDVH